MWVQSLGQEDLLEKGMATHSSVLAWSPVASIPTGKQDKGQWRMQCGLGLRLSPGSI